MEWNGSFCSIENPETDVAKADSEWKAIWSKIGKPAPVADIKKYFGVAVFVGMKPTGGYSVEWSTSPLVQVVAGAVQTKSPPVGIVVRYKVKKPSGMAIEALTQPWAVKLFERPEGGGEIKVEAAHD